MATRPNILVVLTDQMRSTALGCAGVEPVRTPNLDACAAGGVRFTNAVANNPSCTPARASLLTGKHTFSHGLVANDVQLGYDHQTLAHCLNAAGYACGYIGKWHLDGVNRGAYIPPGPRRQGFDAFWAGVECNHHYLAGYYYDEATREPIWFDGYEPEGQTDLALDFIETQAPGDGPWCLFVSWGPPHCPYRELPGEDLALYDGERFPLMPTAVESRVEAKHLRGGPFASAAEEAAQHEWQKREAIAGYYAHISAMDRCFGRLLAGLEAQGVAAETLVVFTSDHGDMLFNHGRGWKGKPWRESVGIPLILRWPGVLPAGRVTDGPISLVDLMPTLLRLAGVPVPEAVEGRDLSAFARGAEDAAPDSVFINYPCVPRSWDLAPWRGVVTRQHTYVATPEGPWLLFDDRADPLQTDNRVGHPAAAAVQARLAAELAAWLERTGDAFESADAVADKYLPSHTGNITVMEPLDPVIRAGQEARLAAASSARRSARDGRG